MNTGRIIAQLLLGLIVLSSLRSFCEGSSNEEKNEDEILTKCTEEACKKDGYKTDPDVDDMVCGEWEEGGTTTKYTFRSRVAFECYQKQSSRVVTKVEDGSCEIDGSCDGSCSDNVECNASDETKKRESACRRSCRNETCAKDGYKNDELKFVCARYQIDGDSFYSKYTFRSQETFDCFKKCTTSTHISKKNDGPCKNSKKLERQVKCEEPAGGNPATPAQDLTNGNPAEGQSSQEGKSTTKGCFFLFRLLRFC